MTNKFSVHSVQNNTPINFQKCPAEMFPEKKKKKKKSTTTMQEIETRCLVPHQTSPTIKSKRINEVWYSRRMLEHHSYLTWIWDQLLQCLHSLINLVSSFLRHQFVRYVKINLVSHFRIIITLSRFGWKKKIQNLESSHVQTGYVQLLPCSFWLRQKISRYPFSFAPHSLPPSTITNKAQ